MIDPHALRTLIVKWRNEKKLIDCYHATMGTGYGACANDLEAVLSALPETPRQILGTWPEHCEQRAFVEGAMWQLMKDERATPYPRERHDAEEAAMERYGLPASPSSPEEPA